LTQASVSHRRIGAVARGFAATMLVVSYTGIAAATGSIWPWLEVVHESGDRTLLGTIFYFEHAARELPLDILLGVAIAGGVLFAFPVAASAAPTTARRRRVLARATAVVIFLILAGTLWTGGWPLLFENLFQFPTRPGEPLEWGGHWRYHLLSQVMLLSSALALSAPLVMWTRGRGGRGHPLGLRTFGAAAGVFAGLTVVFVPALESFVDPVFIGHQAREAFTHGLVTIPAAWGAVLILAGGHEGGPSGKAVSLAWAWAAGAAAVAAGVFLLGAGLAGSSSSLGQTQSLPMLIFPHFFEHTFSYLVVGLVAGWTYESLAEARADTATAGSRLRSPGAGG
jgi:hypothetical protein